MMNFPDSLKLMSLFLISSMLADEVNTDDSSKKIPEMLGSVAAASILFRMSFNPAMSVSEKLKSKPLNVMPKSLLLVLSGMS